MTTMLLVLAGPLQSWGDASRFNRRETRHAPTKSGVLGMLAAADGRRRTDPIEDLTALSFGVRIDQPGTLVRDFQTARPAGAKNSGLSQRYYLSDAVFVAGLEGDANLLAGLVEALRAPAFPLFLGRRSCPPARPIVPEIVESGLIDSLRDVEWQASDWYRRRLPQADARLRVIVDAEAAGTGTGDEAVETVRDVPISYDSVRRQYGWRQVVELDPIRVPNPMGYQSVSGTDWLAEVREA